MQERLAVLTDPAVVEALAHPVRLDVLGYLMSEGPATASQCARAVHDTPSNCSYHLRVLASHGLVEPDPSGDGRSRPWRSTITGFEVETAEPVDATAGTRLLAASVELDHQLAREYLRTRASVLPALREADAHAAYALTLSPAELTDVIRRLDDVIRPYLSATRDDAPPDAIRVRLALTAFPRNGSRPR